jgi:membrane associated rhomboid family serine protease
MTTAIIAITVIVSIIAFSNRTLFAKLLFDPWLVVHRKQWYRLFSHTLVHADYMHLIINMFVLFSFGGAVESYFGQLALAGKMHFPTLWYVFLYVSAVAIASLSTLKKHKDDTMYSAVGASGAVSAVVFCCIFFNPWNMLLIWGIIPIPGFVFALLYLFYSGYMGKKSGQMVNHDAHLYGAIYGLFFPLLIDYHLIEYFVNQLFHGFHF